MPTLETRVISGKGTLKLDPDNLKKVKRVLLYADVIRFPEQDYYNARYNPNKSFYATLNFLRDDYVIHQETLQYANQSWEFAPQEDYQLLYALKCVFAELIAENEQLAAAAAFTLAVNNGIADWKHTGLFWDTVLVVCHADTAIRLVAKSIEYDLCAEDDETDPNPPPPVPDPPPSVPSGTPLSDDNTPVSPPYDGGDDDGDTVPYPDDQFPPPPTEGETCTVYTLSFNVTYTPLGGVHPADDITVSRAPVIYGEVSFDFSINPSDASILETSHRGFPSGGACGDYQLRTIASLGLGSVIRSWDSITLT